MDPYLCCLIGACCPAFSPEQRKRLASMLLKRGVVETMDAAFKVADFHVGLLKALTETVKDDVPPEL